MTNLDRNVMEYDMEKKAGFEEELSFGTDKATTRFPLPFIESKIGFTPDFNRAANAPIGSYGGGTQHVSVGEGLKQFSGMFDGKLIMENPLRPFIGYAIGDWWDYYDGTIYVYPNDKLAQCVTYDATSTDVDNTTEANTDGGTPFGAFPASETTSDALRIGTCVPISGITIDLATVGIGGTITEQYYKNTDAWANLTVGSDGTSELTQDGAIKWTMPTDLKPRYAPTFTGITGKWLYWYQLKVASTYSTNPTINRIRISYPAISTGTLEYGTSISNPEYPLFKGLGITNVTYRIPMGEDVTVTYDWSCKDHPTPPGTVSAATNGLPPRSGSTTGTNQYYQRAFGASTDLTVAFTNAPTGFNTTLANKAARSFELSFNPNTKYDGIVGGTGLSENVVRPKLDATVKIAVDKKNSDFYKWAFADPNAAAGELDLALTLNKSIAIASALQSDPGDATATAITLTTAQAARLHPGDMIKVSESGLTTRYKMVKTISSGTVNLLSAIGTNFTAAAAVAHDDYLKFAYVDLFCPNPDRFEVTTTGGAKVETYTCNPKSFTIDTRQ